MLDKVYRDKKKIHLLANRLQTHISRRIKPVLTHLVFCKMYEKHRGHIISSYWGTKHHVLFNLLVLQFYLFTQN